MPTIKMKRIHLTGEISRVDEEQRIVEGYAFVNEVVPGESGIRLTRAAMEAATADYLANGTVREMHQPIAAGKPLEVTWDDKGALLRAYVADDQAWKKVTSGVYRGFSVGVDPKVMRGKSVTSCEWADASLIDRGKDKDALFTLWRSDTERADDVEIEVEHTEEDPEEVEIERCETIERAKWTAEKRASTPSKNFGWPAKRKYPIEDQDDVDSAAKLIGKAPEAMRDSIKKRIISIAARLNLKAPDAWVSDGTKRYMEATDILRGAFATVASVQLPNQMRYMAFDMLSQALWQIQATAYDDASEMEDDIRMAIDEFADFIVPTVTEKSWPDPDLFADIDTDSDIDRSATPTLQRFAADAKKNAELLRRSNDAEALSIERLEAISELTIERDGMKAELTRVQESEKTAKEEVKRLNALPPRQVPIRNFEGIERKWGYQIPDEAATEVKKLTDEHAEIMRKRNDMTPTERDSAAHRLMVIQRKVTQLGGRL